jgi:cytochrome c-type biogenesis protein CcmH
VLKNIFIIFVFSSPLYAADTPFTFENDAQQTQFEAIIEEVRCLVCQNQSLADSSADLAQDLRQEIFEMVIAGKSDNEILQFLVERYGDFVLYRPPLQSTTWLLWFGPFIFLLASIGFIFRFVKNRSAISDDTLSEEESTKLQELLKERSDGKS